ncbi:MAG TPA: GAF domain-containing protein [Longimicrobiales bacterium]|nr:GAF domain-containing protein [Longimicrobiales bacterium]
MTPGVASPHAAATDPLLALSDDELRRLLRLSHEFNASLDLAELLPRIVRLVLKELRAEAGSIWLRDGDVVRCDVCEGDMGDVLVGLEIPVGAGVAGSVVVTGQPVRVDDPLADSRFLRQVDDATGFQTGSMIAVPLISKGEVLGAIEIANRRGDGEIFSDEQFAFLLALADDAAAAIRNSRAFEAERRARDLKALLRLNHDIAGTLERDRILIAIANLGADAIPYDRCVVALWQDEEPRVAAVSGEEQVDRRSAAIRAIEEFLRWASSRENLWVPDVADADDANARTIRDRFGDYLGQSGARAVLVRPIEDPEGRMAVLLFEFAQPQPLSEWQLETAELIVAGARLALRNAELYAGLPFVSVLEPLARKRRELSLLPRDTWLRYGAAAAVLVLALTAFRIPLRVSATDATVRAAVQRPARAGVSGILETIHVREGDRVAAGDVIGRLRDEELAARLAGARADQESAERSAQAAAARGDAPALAQFRLAAARATEEVRLLEQLSARASIAAPAAGLVLTPRIEERLGSHVEAGAVVAWIGDPDWVEIELLVPQEDVGAIREGDRVRARVPAHPDVTFVGRVAAVGARAAERDGTPVFAVRAILDNRERMLLPGMHARARVLTESRPIGAVLFHRPWRWLRLTSWWLRPF